MRCKQCKQNQKGTPLTFEPKVRINWSMTSHFSLLSSTCRPLNGSRTLTLTSSLPPTDFRPSINWIFKMKQKEVVSVGNNEIQTAANLCFLMPSQPGQLYQGEIRTQIHEKLKILKTPTMKTMQHRHFLLQWKQTGPAISDTIGWYFAQHWTGLPPLEQKMPVLSIHWSGVLSASTGAENACAEHPLKWCTFCLHWSRKCLCWASTEVVYFLPPLEQKMPVLSIHWSGVLSASTGAENACAEHPLKWCTFCLHWSRKCLCWASTEVVYFLPPLEQKMPVLSIHWSGVLSVLFVCYMAGVMWSSCHLGTHSVYTTQLCNPVSEFAGSLHAKPHM